MSGKYKPIYPIDICGSDNGVPRSPSCFQMFLMDEGPQLLEDLDNCLKKIKNEIKEKEKC